MQTKKFAAVLLAAVLAAAVLTSGTNPRTTTVLSDRKSAKFDVYDLRLPQTDGTASGEASYIDAILAYCDYSSTFTVEDLAIAIPLYTSPTLPDYLYDCETITKISVVGEHLYVEYNTFHGEEVILGYSQFGLMIRMIYNPNTDTAFEFSNGVTKRYANFRNGHGGVIS